MATTSKKVMLRSSNGETFEVEEAVAMESQTIKHLIEDNCADNEIPLPNVTSKILSKVLEYCKKHVNAADAKEKIPDDELKAWDADFVKVDRNILFDLILAANFLKIKSLLDLTCQTVAHMIRGKTPEEICKIFNIKNDFTPKEEEEGKIKGYPIWGDQNQVELFLNENVPPPTACPGIGNAKAIVSGLPVAKL